METTPLKGEFGLEVRNVDLSVPLDEATLAEMDHLLATHGVLVFRRQLLSEEDLIRFAGAFGELESTIYDKGVSPYHSEVIYISNLLYPDGGNVGLLGDGEVGWHSDQIYRDRPATGSMLYGVEIVKPSGCTYWADQYHAYETLPDTIKEAIDGRRGNFSYGRRLEAFYPKGQENDETLKTRAPQAAMHPLVLTNPVTGRKALYSDPYTITAIEGLELEESARIVGILIAHCSQPARIYAHDWRQGDIVFWDNGCTLHRRQPIDARHARLMKRMTIYLRPDRHCLPH